MKMNLLKFLKEEIWHVRITKLPLWKATVFRFLRIIILTSQGFSKNEIQQGASALTYYSLMAVVPVIALLIGIARGFLFEKTLETWLTHHFSEQRLIITQIFRFANASLEQAKGGVIAGAGILILAWATVNILMNIELVMNKIWEVSKTRTFAKRFTDYLSMAFIAPIIVFLASGITGYLSAILSTMSQEHILSSVAPFLLWIFSLVSFLLIVLLFTFLYIFMPNTRVRFLPALIAGVFTGIIYQFFQWLYFYFQIGVASYNAIYGTFAALPLFLIWLNLSWMVILMGAKICYAVQNVDAFEYIAEDEELSHKIQTICSLRIAHFCIKKFARDEPAPTAIEISNELEIPHPLTSKILHQLLIAHILSESKRENQEETYQPARNVEGLTIKRVLDMIDDVGAKIPLPASPELTLILKSLEQFTKAMEKSKGNILLKDF